MDPHRARTILDVRATREVNEAEIRVRLMGEISKLLVSEQKWQLIAMIELFLLITGAVVLMLERLL